MTTRRSTRIPLAVLPLRPEDRGGSIGSPVPSKVSSSSALKFSTTSSSSLSFPTNALASSSFLSREPSPARRLFAEPSSSSSYGFGSPRSLTPKLGDLPSTDPPSPFLVTSQRSPTPYPVGSPNAFATSSSPSRNGPSSTPTRTPSRRLNNLPPLPPLQPDTPSTSTGPGTAGCGFDIYHDGASPINGASSSSSSLFDSDLVAASPAPSDPSIFEDDQPDKENKAPASIRSIPFLPSPLKRRRDLELEQQEEEEQDEEEDEQPLASTSSLTGSPVKGGKGKGRELSFVPEVEEEVEEELVSVVTSVSKGKRKSRVKSTRDEGKGKGRAILELEADEGDLAADEGLELTPGRRIPVVAVEKKRAPPRSPEKKRRGQ